jgi:hypothetical protein
MPGRHCIALRFSVVSSGSTRAYFLCDQLLASENRSRAPRRGRILFLVQNFSVGDEADTQKGSKWKS